MIWADTGYLLSKNKYNENSLIAEIYTKNHGKISGIIFVQAANFAFTSFFPSFLASIKDPKVTYIK